MEKRYEFEVAIKETFTKTVKVVAEDYDEAYNIVDTYVNEGVKGYNPSEDGDADYHRDLEASCGEIVEVKPINDDRKFCHAFSMIGGCSKWMKPGTKLECEILYLGEDTNKTETVIIKLIDDDDDDSHENDPDDEEIYFYMGMSQLSKAIGNWYGDFMIVDILNIE